MPMPWSLAWVERLEEQVAAGCGGLTRIKRRMAKLGVEPYSGTTRPEPMACFQMQLVREGRKASKATKPANR